MQCLFNERCCRTIQPKRSPFARPLKMLGQISFVSASQTPGLDRTGAIFTVDDNGMCVPLAHAPLHNVRVGATSTSNKRMRGFLLARFVRGMCRPRLFQILLHHSVRGATTTLRWPACSQLRASVLAIGAPAATNQTPTAKREHPMDEQEIESWTSCMLSTRSAN